MTTAETTITNRRGDVARVSRLVSELATAHLLSPGVVADVQVALDEVLTNIISYAYADDRIHQIRVRLTVASDVFEAEVEDDGQPFNPLTVPSPNLGASLRERSVGGLGIHFVKGLMSDVAYARIDDRNRLILKKRLTGGTEADARGSA